MRVWCVCMSVSNIEIVNVFFISLKITVCACLLFTVVVLNIVCFYCIKITLVSFLKISRLVFFKFPVSRVLHIVGFFSSFRTHDRTHYFLF